LSRLLGQREPALDFASAVDAGRGGIEHPEILERAAKEDPGVARPPDHAQALPQPPVGRKIKPGLLIGAQGAPTGMVVEAMLVLWAVSDPVDSSDQVYHLPSLTRHVFQR
jgi:hypothetical protein